MSDVLHFLANANVALRKLPMLPRIASGFIKVLILRQPVLRTLELTVTPDCNLKCEMCYATKLKRPGHRILTTDEYRNLWLQAKKLGAFSVIISGGEPTMRDDLFEIFKAVEAKRTIVGMVSNATRLDRDYLLKLRDAGVRILHLSLNSIDAAVNDRERDFPGHRAKVDELLGYAKELGINVCLSVVVAHGELSRLSEVAEYAKSRHAGVSVSLACPSGKWEDAHEHLMTEEDWREVDAYMRTHPWVRADWTTNLSLRRECPGGREKICISPYGEAMTCGMNFISFGNIRCEPLRTIWERMREWPSFAARSPNCLIGANPDYIKRFLIPAVAHDTLPVPVGEVDDKDAGRNKAAI